MVGDWIPVIVAAVTAAGAASAAFLGRQRIANHKLLQAESEIKFQREALTFPDFIQEWGDTNNALISLLETTNVDRFLILRAWNGRLEPRWTTSVYQLRQGEQAPISYIHFELDADYVDRIQEMVRKGSLYFSVDDVQNSAIRDIYLAEGVTASYWAHLDSSTLEGTESRAITYCSFATHEPGGLTEVDITNCKIVTGRLKGLALSFDQQCGTCSD